MYSTISYFYVCLGLNLVIHFINLRSNNYVFKTFFEIKKVNSAYHLFFSSNIHHIDTDGTENYYTYNKYPVDLEKKVKTIEADMIQLQEDLSASERQRRAAETERDDLAEELANYNSRGSLLSDEKRRLDTR